VVIDEIQRLPQLLDEVHSPIATHAGRFRFAMLGSSARKLGRLDVNLLAGRAIRREFFPLTGREMDYDFALAELLAFGTLPTIRTDVRDAVDVLEAYTSTYLREEIQQESLIRDLPCWQTDRSPASRRSRATRASPGRPCTGTSMSWSIP
jgi:predicted AAA+ superfamily ATPase